MRAWGCPPVRSSIHSKQARQAENRIFGALPIITGPETPAGAAPSLSGIPSPSPNFPAEIPLRGPGLTPPLQGGLTVLHVTPREATVMAVPPRGKDPAAGNDALSGQPSRDKGDSAQEQAAGTLVTDLGKSPSLHPLLFTYLQVCRAEVMGGALGSRWLLHINAGAMHRCSCPADPRHAVSLLTLDFLHLRCLPC